MSSISRANISALLVAATLIAGCASAPVGTPQSSSDAQPNAAGAAFTPATAEEREISERMPPLERANFWARQYAITPDDLTTSLLFADALRGIGSEERAVEVMREAAVIHPSSSDVMLVMGRALAAQDELVDSRRAFQAAVGRDPSSADALAALGLAHDRLGDHASAQMAYRQALEIEPQRPSTLSNFGLSLAMTGDIETAEARLRDAVALNAANTQVRQNLALVLGLQGRYDEMMDIAGDAPEAVMRDNVEALRALRGDSTAQSSPAAPTGLRSTTG